MISDTFKPGGILCVSTFLFALTGCHAVQNDSAVPESPQPLVEVKSPQKSVPHREKAEDLPFAPTFIPQQAAFDCAYSIYNSSKGKPTGVHVCHGVVFVIVNIDLGKEKLRYVKGTAMLRGKALLNRKYNLPAKYSLVSRVLEDRNYPSLKRYRYTLAYREKDILALTEP